MSLLLALLLLLNIPVGPAPERQDKSAELRRASQRRALVDRSLGELRSVVAAADGRHFELARTLARLGAAEQTAPILLDLLDTPDDPEVQLRALQVLEAFGPTGVEVLRGTIEAETLGRLGAQGASRTTLDAHLALLEHPDERLRQSARRALESMGSAATEGAAQRDSLVHLRRLYGRWRAAREQLRSIENPGVRAELERALEELVPALHTNAGEPARVARKFARLGGERVCLPTLVDGLRDRDEGVRARALVALDALGAQGSLAVIDLALAGETRWLRSWKQGDTTQLAQHLELLDTDDTLTRRGVAVVLANMGPEATAAVAAGLERVSRDEVLKSVRAARAFGADARPFVDPLAKYALGDDLELARAAVFSLAALVPRATPVLVRCLRHTDVGVRRLAAEGLARAVPAIPWDGPPVHPREVEAYGARYGAPPERDDALVLESLSRAVRSMADALDDDDPEVRAHVAFALWRLGDRAEGALPELRAAQADACPIVATWVRTARARLAPRSFERVRLLAATPRAGATGPADPRDTLGPLMRSLDEGDTWHVVPTSGGRLVRPARGDQRFRAALALARMATDLIASVEAGDSRAELARTALVGIEREAERHLADLVRLLDDEDRRGGDTARELVQLLPFSRDALGHDLMRFPRFPVGPPTYEELVWVLQQGGAGAVPILAWGLEHWTPWGRELCARALVELGPDALPALPAVLSAWRSGGVLDGFPGSDTWWDELAPVLIEAMGPGAEPWLERAREDPDPIVQARARASGSRDER